MEEQNTLPSLAPLNLTVTEAATVLRLSRAKVYQLIEQEGLPTVHFGRAVRIPVTLLHHWQNERIHQTRLT